MTDDGKNYTYVWDAFNRLRQVKTRGGSPALVSEYRYNGLGWRISWKYDNDRAAADGKTDGTVDSYDHTYFFCQDERWRIIGTFRDSDSNPKERFVYHAAGLGGTGGSSYIDDVVLRQKDANTAWTSASDGTLEERDYYCQNWRHDVSIVLSDAGKIVETIKYSAYGVPLSMPAGDTDSNGTWDTTDSGRMSGGSTTDPRLDPDQNGSKDAAGATWANAIAGRSGIY